MNKSVDQSLILEENELVKICGKHRRKQEEYLLENKIPYKYSADRKRILVSKKAMESFLNKKLRNKNEK